MIQRPNWRVLKSMCQIARKDNAQAIVPTTIDTVAMTKCY